MKYLGKEPIVFGYAGAAQARPQVVETGGPANVIPKKYLCAGGRHDTRLTECWCAKFDG